MKMKKLRGWSVLKENNARYSILNKEQKGHTKKTCEKAKDLQYFEKGGVTICIRMLALMMTGIVSDGSDPLMMTSILYKASLKLLSLAADSASSINTYRIRENQGEEVRENRANKGEEIRENRANKGERIRESRGNKGE